jgi:ubiquinone/menaquinone biosynthesis C-methylase UbiE
MTNNFWEEKLIQGYYDKVLKKGLKKNRGLQAAWHHTIFLKSAEEISIDDFHLDIACGPGTFIGNYINAKSTGIDIVEKQIQYAKKN